MANNIHADLKGVKGNPGISFTTAGLASTNVNVSRTSCRVSWNSLRTTALDRACI